MRAHAAPRGARRGRRRRRLAGVGCPASTRRTTRRSRRSGPRRRLARARCTAPGSRASSATAGPGPAKLQLSVARHRVPVPGRRGRAAWRGRRCRSRTSTGTSARRRRTPAGNFYILLSDWAPHYPTQMTVTSRGRQAPASRCSRTSAATARARTATRPPRAPTRPGPSTSPPPPGRRLTVLARALPFLVARSVRRHARASRRAPACRTRSIGIDAPPYSLPSFMPVGDYLGNRCGTLDCHGQTGRNFRMWGCEGMRLAPDADPSSCVRTRPTTDDEYQRHLPLARRPRAAGHEHGVRRLRGLYSDGGVAEYPPGATCHPELLTFIRKARGIETHKGGQLICVRRPAPRAAQPGPDRRRLRHPRTTRRTCASPRGSRARPTRPTARSPTTTRSFPVPDAGDQ